MGRNCWLKRFKALVHLWLTFLLESFYWLILPLLILFWSLYLKPSHGPSEPLFSNRQREAADSAPWWEWRPQDSATDDGAQVSPAVLPNVTCGIKQEQALTSVTGLLNVESAVWVEMVPPCCLSLPTHVQFFSCHLWRLVSVPPLLWSLPWLQQVK